MFPLEAFCLPLLFDRANPKYQCVPKHPRSPYTGHGVISQREYGHVFCFNTHNNLLNMTVIVNTHPTTYCVCGSRSLTTSQLTYLSASIEHTASLLVCRLAFFIAKPISYSLFSFSSCCKCFSNSMAEMEAGKSEPAS